MALGKGKTHKLMHLFEAFKVTFHEKKRMKILFLTKVTTWAAMFLSVNEILYKVCIWIAVAASKLVHYV